MPQRIDSFTPPTLKTKESRPHAAARGYCSKNHRSWRHAVLMADAFACRSCGTISESNHADHIVPVSARPDLRYDTSNGQTLCPSCHMQKTMREARGSSR
jgi:5-methylcytosine-specific restriction endonuclease McrA